MKSIQGLLVFLSVQVGWFIITKIAPILKRQSVNLWKIAWPLATDIVKDLTDDKYAHLDGLDKHKEAVARLKQQLSITHQELVDEIETIDLQHIILSAFFELPTKPKKRQSKSKS